MNNSGNIFSSNYSTSNPFNMNGMGNMSSSLDNSLMESYAKLEALKQKQAELANLSQQKPDAQVRRTVFTDISDEFKELSDDETNFIVNSPEYQALNSKYQTEFSQFLISKFSNEYLQTNNSRTLEDMLHEIRRQKDKYKEKFAEDINEIRDQNKVLIDKNNELAKNNQELQAQLKEIQSKLWKE